MFRALPIVIGVTFLARAAFAADAPAATQPIDQTTPKGALKVFTRAIQTADTAKVRACLHTANNAEEDYAKGYAAVSVGVGKLRGALVAKFGEEAGAAFKQGSESEQMKRIDAATEKIDGEQASVTMAAPESETIQLVKVNGAWKLSISKMIARKSAQQVKDDIKAMTTYSAALNDTSKEITAGKYADAKAAMEALQKKLKGEK
jgi:hypothetical protein